MRYVNAGDIGDLAKGHTAGVAAVAFSPNGAALASAGLDGKVCIWDISNGLLQHVFIGSGSILSLAWAQDGLLLCGVEDGSIAAITVSTVRGISSHVLAMLS